MTTILAVRVGSHVDSNTVAAGRRRSAAAMRLDPLAAGVVSTGGGE